jgi:hypothetical protein
MLFIFNEIRGAGIMVERRGKLKKIATFSTFYQFFLEKRAIIVYDLN